MRKNRAGATPGAPAHRSAPAPAPLCTLPALLLSGRLALRTRFPDAPDEVPAFNFAIGDARAARAFAESALGAVSRRGDRRNARLLLTAMILHLDAQNGPEPSLQEVAESLAKIGERREALIALHQSPAQLVRYAADELASLSPLALRLAVADGLRALTRCEQQNGRKPCDAVKQQNTA